MSMVLNVMTLVQSLLFMLDAIAEYNNKFLIS